MRYSTCTNLCQTIDPFSAVDCRPLKRQRVNIAESWTQYVIKMTTNMPGLYPVLSAI